MARSNEGPARAGRVAFFLLTLTAAVYVILGLSAVTSDDVFDEVTSRYFWSLTLTTWGWVHIVLGAAFAVSAVLVARRDYLGSLVGLVTAAAGCLISFAFLPYAPGWSVVAIVVDASILVELARSDAPAPAASRPR